MIIRDGKVTVGGMSFDKWQELARIEVANHIRDCQRRTVDAQAVTNRFFLTGGAALITIGFWGTMVALGETNRLIAAIIMVIAGLGLFAIAGEWRIRI